MEQKPTSDDDLTLAFQLADAAGAISLAHFRRPIRRWSKTDGSLATEADLAVEDAIRARLGVERPGDAVLGEERGQTGSSNRRWIVDGIDGTVDFAAGTDDLLVVEEAGGRYSDIDGRYDWTTGSAVFSNGYLHDDVIRIAALT